MQCALQPRGTVSRGEHVCLPFQDYDERRNLLPFSLASGLRRGERLLYLSHATPEDALFSLLHEAGADAHRFQARGQVRVVPAAEVFLAEGAFSSSNAMRALTRYKREALWDGCSGLRVAVEMTWALSAGFGCAELADYEATMNELVGDGPPHGIVGVCLYDARRFTTHQMAGVTRLHGLVVRGETDPQGSDLTIVPQHDPPGLRLSGEIDLTTCDRFAEALFAAIDSGSDVFLDMSAVRFVDLSAIRLLLRASARCDARTRVVVFAPPQMLNRVLEASGSRLPASLCLIERPGPARRRPAHRERNQWEQDREEDSRGRPA